MDRIEESRALPAKSLDFWFDYTCPYAYLGSTYARPLAAKMKVPLTYQPILLGGIFKAVNTPQNLFASRSPVRIAHDASDLQRWAERRGVSLKMPAGHPLRSVEALRATLATGIDQQVIDNFYRAYWVENREISTPEVITEVVTAAGHDAKAVLTAIATDAIKEDLRARTERGIALGMFGVPVWIVDGEHFYWGQDREAHIIGTRPAPRASVAPNPKTRVLDVYFDFSSPFAYLGCSQVEAVAARTGATVKWHPILLGGLFKSLGGPEVPLALFSPQKQRWALQDLVRWAATWKVPFAWPSRFPTASLKALRVYLALPEAHRARFRDGCFKAMWAEDRDITNDEVLADCIGDADAATAAFARTSSDEVKATLRAETEQAMARGVFGVPTFAVGDDLYWGQDRLDLVEDALRVASPNVE